MRIRFEPRARRPPQLAVSVDRAVAAAEGETGLDLTGARVRIGFSRGHLLEVVVSMAACSSAADEHALAAADRLLEALLGAAVFDDWIGAVDVAPAPRPGSLRVLPDGRAPPPEEALPLADVLAAVSAAIAGVDAALPEVPYFAIPDCAEWTLLEATPAPAHDYSAQDDVVLFSTRLPEAMKSFLQGAPFSSRRFSKHDERFVYAKIDARERTAEERFRLRVALEDALDGALVPEQFGCVVGAGVGERYVYVALALARVGDGIKAACAALRASGVPPRSWILFYDSEWADDWAGVWDDTVEPP